MLANNVSTPLASRHPANKIRATRSIQPDAELHFHCALVRVQHAITELSEGQRLFIKPGFYEWEGYEASIALHACAVDIDSVSRR